MSGKWTITRERERKEERTEKRRGEERERKKKKSLITKKSMCACAEFRVLSRKSKKKSISSAHSSFFGWNWIIERDERTEKESEKEWWYLSISLVRSIKRKKKKKKERKWTKKNTCCVAFIDEMMRIQLDRWSNHFTLPYRRCVIDRCTYNTSDKHLHVNCMSFSRSLFNVSQSVSHQWLSMKTSAEMFAKDLTMLISWGEWCYSTLHLALLSPSTRWNTREQMMIIPCRAWHVLSLVRLLLIEKKNR